jgi:hypothetical protein
MSQVFDAIKAFILSLNETFNQGNKKANPLNLYGRLIKQMQFVNTDSVKKVVGGFKSFFKEYSEIVNNDITKLPNDIQIKYGNSEKVFIEITRYIKLSTAETQNVIKNHLLAINALMNPTKENIEALKKVEDVSSKTSSFKGSGNTEGKSNDSSSSPNSFINEKLAQTNEGKLVGDILNNVKESMENAGLGSTEDVMSNPLPAIMGLMQSGVLQNTFSALQSGIDGKTLNFRRLIGVVTSLIPSEEEDENAQTTTVSTTVKESTIQTTISKTPSSNTNANLKTKRKGKKAPIPVGIKQKQTIIVDEEDDD